MALHCTVNAEAVPRVPRGSSSQGNGRLPGQGPFKVPSPIYAVMKFVLFVCLQELVKVPWCCNDAI